jgi:hypothetical protein
MHGAQIFLIVLSTVVGGAAFGSDPATHPSSTNKVRAPGDAPAIELADAVTMARRYASENHIDLTKHYLQSASFDSSSRCWRVVWQVPSAKGGRTEFTIPEVGKMGVAYGE